jgi:hypothetical protein
MMKKLLLVALSGLLVACGNTSNKNAGGDGATPPTPAEPTKLSIKFKRGLDGPDQTLEVDGKKAVIVTEKTKFGYGADAPELVTHKLMIGNYEFDPKTKTYKPNAEGQILVTATLYAAKDAPVDAPPAAGTYGPSKYGEPATANLRVGSILVDYYTVESGVMKSNAFEISNMGMVHGAVKLNAPTGTIITGSIDDYGAGQFNNVKGSFTATLVK